MRNVFIKLLLIRFRHKLLHPVEIMAKCSDTLFPSAIAFRRGRLRPVTLRPFGGPVTGIATKFEDVPLGYPHVFNELPGGVGKSPDLLAAQLRAEPANGFIEAGMSP